jgi:hypothetical protein
VGHTGTVTCMGWHCRSASISSPHCHCCSPSPPCEQLLTAVVGGATVVVWLGGTWLVAPGPPCKQVLAVVGDRCWSAIPLLPCTLAVEPHNPPYEQVLIGMGWVCPLSLQLSDPGTHHPHRLQAPAVHPTSRCLQAWGRCWLIPDLTGFRGTIGMMWQAYEGWYIPGKYPVTSWCLPSSVAAVIPLPYPILFIICHSRSSLDLK